MGWRIGFGVGPLRYSTPLTSRRRTLRRQTAQYTPTYNPPGVTYDRRLTQTDRVVIAVMLGLVVAAGIVLMLVAAG